ncbi:hypothetical protein F2Q68_00001246 [Brassica cretica]|uniref:Uncharacterized protein n=2 Tax=Brassica cretica TaxID=69181 RepID=A0A3N6UEF0_BRACR|nr:hypothetical protein F2Q68_00001246 [Brassica cretica]KAF3548400.1 hypothetical protein DY000_02001659 [Brassica cretica]
MSRMLDTPPKKIGHIRARSEILTLLDDLRFDSDLGVVGTSADGACFSDDTEEDLLSLYLDMDKFGSSAQVVEPLGTAWKVESLMHIQAQHLMDLVEKAAFIFCVEDRDRALLCRDCDEATHAPNTRSANHQSNKPDQEALPAAEVPELSHVHSYNRPMKSNVSNKKPRFEISYDMKKITSLSLT